LVDKGDLNLKRLSIRQLTCIFIVLSVISLILLGSGYFALNYINNTRMGIRSSIWSVTNLTKATLNRNDVIRRSQGEFTNIFFLHHSVGQHLIDEGHVRQLFQNAGYDFWDQGYNQDEGQRDPQGNRLEFVYYVPHDNTDIDGYQIIFTQPTFGLPFNTFSGLLQHEVIIFKSCFPNSHIISPDQLEQDKEWYLDMRATFENYPEKVFIILTQPPLNPAETNPEAALRARELTAWLTSDEFLNGHSNLFVFDFFDLLAENDFTSIDANMLRREYRNGSDSHPNQLANETIGPLFVDFVLKSIQTYQNNQ